MPSENYAVRISLPFSDVSGVVRAWALHADQLVCYEHIGSETEKVHVHLLLMDVRLTTDRLKQLAKSLGIAGQGNQFWSFKTKTRDGGPITEDTAPKYIVYMSKGQHDPKYNKGFDNDWLLERKAEWVECGVSENQRLCTLFEVYVNQNMPSFQQQWYTALKTDLKINLLDVVEKASLVWAFHQAGSIWSPRAQAIKKMVFITYAMKHGHTLDPLAYRLR